jgi:hypothetical protein
MTKNNVVTKIDWQSTLLGFNPGEQRVYPVDNFKEVSRLRTVANRLKSKGYEYSTELGDCEITVKRIGQQKHITY